MNTDPEIYAEGLSNFVNEAQELLQRIEQDLWQLHEEKSNATVHSLMRSTHTLKGASASVDLENIREIAHALEDIFKSLYNPDITIDAELEKYLFQAYETLQSLVTEELVKNQQGEESEENAPVSPTMQTARDIIEKIKDYLGDAYNPDAEIPSSEELGFDMVQSIFEIGVKQRLESLQATLKSADSEEVANNLRSIAEIFVGLSESLKLPGFGDIAKTVLTAVEFNPDLAIKIAEVALEDFWEAVQAVLNGDRTQGGEPSQKLKNLAKSPSSSSHQEPTPSVSSLPGSASTGSATTEDFDSSLVQYFTEDTETEKAEPAAETTSNSQDTTTDTTIDSGETDASAQFSESFGEFPSQQTEEVFSAGGELDDVFGSFDPNAIETGDYSEQGEAADFSQDEGDTNQPHQNYADFGGLEVEEMVEVPSPESSAEPSVETEEASEPFDKLRAAAEDKESVEHPESNSPTTTSSNLTQKTDRELEKDSVPLSQWEEVSPSPVSSSATASSSPAGGKESQPFDKLRAAHRETTTVRVDLEQLERLNFQAGELLIEHNKQYSGTEDLQASVKKLQEQLSQHQKLLSSLQSLAWSINAKQSHDGVSNSLNASSSWGASRKSRSGKQSPRAERSRSIRHNSKSSQQANPNSTERRPELAEGRRPELAEGLSGQASNSSIESLKSSFPASKIGNLDSLEMDNYSQMQMLLQSAYEEMVQMQEVADSIDLYSKRSSSALHKQQRLLTKVRDDLTLARMQPIGEVLERFPRTVRQLCMTHDKDVALQIRGEDVLVDKAIAQKLYDPLLHLVRNAFSHGIEAPDQRQAKGKPAQGKIEIRAYTQGNRTTIEIRDDGKGIDYEAIRQRAIAQGLISTSRASTLRYNQLLEFIFETGFSTAQNVDNVSGRGVGLDVVRSQLNEMGAGITVTSHPDKGTCFRLQLPLTLSIAKLLVHESYGVYYAIPSETIEQILFPEATEITYVGKQRVLSITREGKEYSVPIYRLEDLIHHTSSIPIEHSTPTNGHHRTNETGWDAAALNSPKFLSTSGENEDASLVLLLNSAIGLVGLEVESILGEQELVIRPLSKVVRAPQYVYGCSILANSHLALVIDVLDLIQDRIPQGNTATAAPSRNLAASPASNAYSTQAIASATSSALSTSSAQRQANNTSVKPNRNASMNGSYESGREAVPSVQNRRVSSVMVVDDSITLRQNVITTLQKAGYRAVTARDGQEALDKLRGGESVDVILCDIEMPRINGFEFLSQYRQNEDISDIPTIMLTSRQGDKHRNIATGLGAVGYITKPYLERDLLAEIEQHLPSSSSSS